MLGLVVLIDFSISIRDTNMIMDDIHDYFNCQATGFSANHTCYAEYNKLESHLNPGLDSATYIFLGLLSWPNLLFTVQVSDIKKAVQKVMRLYSSHGSQNKLFSTSINI